MSISNLPKETVPYDWGICPGGIRARGNCPTFLFFGDPVENLQLNTRGFGDPV